jgi:hypothetical protein
MDYKFFGGLWRLCVGGVGGQLLLNFIDKKRNIFYAMFNVNGRSDFI